MPRMNAPGQQHTPSILQRRLPFPVHAAILFVVAFALRWSYLSGTHLELQYPVSEYHLQHPTSALMIGDADLYFSEAKAFLTTGSLGLPYRPPGTTILLASAMAIGTPSYLTAHIWQILLGASIPILFAALALKWFNRRIAIVTGWLTATAFPLIILSGTLCSETHLLFLMATALLLLETPRTPFVAFAGLMFGLAMLTRAESALFIALIFLREFVIRRHTLRPRLVLIITFCLPVMIWSIRNYIVLDDAFPNAPLSFKYIPVSANGPLNFYLGNGPMASGGYRSFKIDRPDSQVAAEIDFSDPIQAGAFFHGYRRAMDHLYFHREQIQPLLKRKLSYFSRGLRTGFGLENYPLGLRGVMRRGDVWTPVSPVSFYILSLGWVLGLVLARPHSFKPPASHATWTTLFFIASSLVVCVLFFGLARNAAILLPFLFIGFAAFLDRLATFILEPVPKKIIPESVFRGIGTAAMIFLVVFTGWQAWDHHRHPVAFTSTNALFSQMVTTGDDTYTRQDLIREYERALQRMNDAGRIIIFEESLSTFYVGLAYAVNGDDPDRVERLIDAALRLDIANAAAWKLKGIQASKDSKTQSEAIRAFERYLQINPWSEDAAMIRDMITRMKYQF
ncbi:MAG TPA: glycosyltransferase family 39 protein [bacterium]|nr:glycosyltransferase family 39 protein [bacterium]